MHLRGVEEDGLAWAGAMIGYRGGEASREVEEDVAEDDIRRGDVETVRRVVEGIAVQWVGVSRKVREVVREVG